MIDIWCKPYDLTNSIVEKLNLSKLSMIDFVNLDLIPQEKRDCVNLVTLLSTEEDYYRFHAESQKYNIKNCSFVLSLEVFAKIQKNILDLNKKYYIYVNKIDDVLNLKNLNVFFFTDIEKLYDECTNIDFFWPELAYSEEKFNSLKVNTKRKKSIIPFSIFNSDASLGVNFNPIGNCLYKYRSGKSIDISIIIPHYDNLNNLKCVLNNLKIEIEESVYNIEVVVVDDGSLISSELMSLKSIFDMSIVQLPRNQKRKMGDCAYRAGVARNLGALHASGLIYLFQDCDILLGHNFLNSIVELHKTYGLIMPKRFQLNQGIVKNFKDIQLNDISISQNSYWTEFYESTEDWNTRLVSWKYVSSYCLSIESQSFFQLGGFSSTFVSYGCEDVDLGFRIYNQNKQFFLSNEKVYHLQPPIERSEFLNDTRVRQNLLKRSYFYLYKRSYSEEVFNELILGKQSRLLFQK